RREATKNKIAQTHFKEGSADENVISTLKARAFTVTSSSTFAGKSIGDIERQFDDKLTFEKVFRAEKFITYDLTTTLVVGDVITLVGLLDAMVQAENSGLTETAENQYLELALTKGDIVLTKDFKPEMLVNLKANNIIITDIKHNVKKENSSKTVGCGDVLSVSGPKAAVRKIATQFGYQKDTGIATDVSFLSICIVVGLLIGAICLTVSGIPITLGSGGGVLIAGLLFGWYQNNHAKHGRIPAATRWFLKSVGLNLFIAVVGLTAGGKFLGALQQMGGMVLLLGVAVTLLPHIITLYFGKFVLKMDAVDIIGGQCGAGTCTAALNGVIEESGSSIFAMSYTPGYAVGNVMITVLGPLIVALLI
ncbi:MAG: aspartate-alanine antiporter, partial [Oscillospiraceae bacterium]